MNYKTCAALIASLLLVACAGGSGGGDDDGVDAFVVPLPDGGTNHQADASPFMPDAAPAGGCTATVSNSGPSQTAGFYLCGSTPVACESADPTAADLVSFLGPLNGDALPDYLSVELYPGYGVFSSGLTTGTFSLTGGDEGNYSTCGACVTIMTDVNTASSPVQWVDDYFQTAGSITITGFTTGDATTPSTVSGSISSLVLDHVTINDSTYESTIVGDCSTNVANFEFSAQLTDYTSN